jgi:ATP-dependent exoDNAse (exonuclease V) beta subunit
MNWGCLVTTDERLFDHEARVEITEKVFTSHFVIAGAGAGKTSAMISRIANSIGAGVGIEQILAITFTEAAANEIKVRLRRELISRLNSPGEDEVTISRIRSALGGLNVAPIGTIHSFANSVISRYPLEAGLPIVFATTDPSSKMMIFDLAIRRYYDFVATSSIRVRLHEIISQFGFDESNVIALAKEIDETFITIAKDEDYLDHLESAIGKFDSIYVDQIIDRAIELLLTMAKLCSSESDPLLEAIRSTFIPNLRLLLGSEATSDKVFKVLALLGKSKSKKLFGKLPKGKGQGANWGGSDSKKQLVEDFNFFIDTVMAEIGTIIDDLVRLFVFDVSMAVSEERLLRQEKGKITFSDQIRLCYELLLSADDELLFEIAQTYRVILIDEFQDTDPVQVAIFDRLASAAGATLFFVGDPRQGIYRFRGADPETYLEVASRDHVKISLTSNFRSHPDIVSWVNDLFERTFNTSLNFQLDPMVAARMFHHLASDSVDVVLPFVNAIEKRTATQRRQAQAKSVAYLVRQYLDDEIEVDGQLRPIRPSDIAVLFPTRTVLGAIKRSFADVGIPYRSVGGASIVDEPYIAEVLLFLRAALRPYDQLALVQLLQSESVGLTNDELFGYLDGSPFAKVISLSRERLQTPGYPVANAIEAALAVLEELKSIVRESSLADGVNFVVGRYSILEKGLRTSGEDFLRHFDTFLGYCRDFDSRGTPAESFVSYIEGILMERQALTEAEGRDVESDAVRLMTIHASKGLEFPIVIVVATPKGGGSRSSVEILANSNERIRLSLESLSNRTIEVKLNPKLRTNKFEEVAKAEGVADADEEIRLFYVAATRAMNKLAVVLEEDLPPTKTGVSKAAPKVHNELFKLSGILIRDFNPDDEVITRFVNSDNQYVREIDQNERQRLFGQIADVVTRKRRTTASMELEVDHEVGEFESSGNLSRTRSIEIGIAVHEAVSKYVGAESLEHRQSINSVIENLETQDMRDRARLAVTQFVEWLDGVGVNSSSATALTEFSFSVLIDGVLNDGVIDLAYVDQDAIQIVDYKVLGNSDESYLDGAIAHYSIQAEYYRRAIKAIYPSVNVLPPIFLYSTANGLRTHRYE